MATIIGTAFAFAGASAVTNIVTKYITGDDGERKRHNLAIEKFNQDREEYSRKRQQRFDYINKTLRQQKHAEQTFSDLEKAGQLYYKVTGDRLPTLKEPKFSDYFNPSKKQKDGELAFITIGIGTLALGVLAYKFIGKRQKA